MGVIRFLALGAGQDVGRSCIVISMGGKNIMFDCGMHMGYNDERRFPDFTLLNPLGKDLNLVIDAVIITHFHLDHCGALPYMTEMCGYNGPIFMTFPTKALCPILLEDFRKLMVEKKGELDFFTLPMIKTSVGKVKPLQVHQSHLIEPDFEIKPYYAGHVLGAAMFWVRVGKETVLYTGDYNMTPDRHLGAAWVDLKLCPDILITESTYATTLRDSKRARERDFLRNIHQCVASGGKVLIPVFALGRVQELCILIEEYWQRMGLDNVPVYFSAGMAEMANEYYKIFVDWTNEKLEKEYVTRNMFDFKHVKPFEKYYAEHPGPMVLFSSPGMLHSGMSLEIFKKWCGDDKNLLIIPGFCVSGTVGAKLLAGQRKIQIEEPSAPNGFRLLNVKMQVKNMSFSAHADARGIMQLIKIAEPKNVVLVHGEAAKMTILKSQILKEMGIPCFDPPNGQVVHIESSWSVALDCKEEFTKLYNKKKEMIEQIANDPELDENDLFKLAAARSRPEVPFEGLIKWTREELERGDPPVLKPFCCTHDEENDDHQDDAANWININVDLEKNLGDPCELQRKLQKALLPNVLVELLDCKKEKKNQSIDDDDDEEMVILKMNSIKIRPTTGKVTLKGLDYKLFLECMRILEIK